MQVKTIRHVLNHINLNREGIMDTIINSEERKVRHLYVLDGFRIICAFFVFLYHSNSLVDYGFFEPFISVSAIFMDAFFLLSGFSLYYGYKSKKLDSSSEILSFYKKRVIKLYPAYLVVYIAWFIIHQLVLKDYPTYKTVFITPIETLLIQCIFPKSESIIHNSGSWFISVIFFCYLLFPLVKRIVQDFAKKQIIVLWIILYFLCSGMPFFSHGFSTDAMYFNPFFRFFEFFMGLLIGQYFSINKDAKSGDTKNHTILFISVIVLFSLVTIYVKLNLNFCMYLAFCFMTLPLFSLQILLLAKNASDSVILKTKAVQFVSKISYEYFLAQHFCFDPVKYFSNKILNTINGGGGEGGTTV